MITNLVSRLWWRRYLARNARSWQDLDAFPKLAPAERRRRMGEALLAQLRYFGSRADALPEWNEAAAASDPGDVLRLWPQLPILTKQAILARFPAAEIGKRFAIEGHVDSSGGSTGEPTRFFHDTAMLKTAVALNACSRLRMGWRPGMPTIILWGSERDIGKRTSRRTEIQNRLLQDCMVDGYSLSGHTVDRVLRLISRKWPVAIYGFTSMLEYVARETLSRGSQPPPGHVRTAWNGGELLLPEQSEVFQRAFGVPILNRYGGREVSAVACQARAGGPLEIFRPWQFAEIVDENGRPAAPGQIGRLLWTSTVCRGTPFLRYDSGDLGVCGEDDIDEAGLAAIRELHGRSAALFELPDGRKISNLYWNHLFKEFPEVGQFQVVLLRSGGVRLLLKGEPFTPAREERLRGMLRHALAGTPVEVSWVPRIPLTERGKLLQVVREPQA
jgi:phenylacetate-CoA ligase